MSSSDENTGSAGKWYPGQTRHFFTSDQDPTDRAGTSDTAPPAPAAVGREIGMPMDDLVAITKFLSWLGERDGVIAFNSPGQGRVKVEHLGLDYMRILIPVVQDINEGRSRW